MKPVSDGSNFVATRWTLVERSRGQSAEAKAALRELCEGYYAPVVAFLRREGNAEEVARDLAHEFFANLLSGNSLGSAQHARGRFRSYLLGAVKHFLTNHRRDAATEKRGGGAEHVAIGPGTDTSPGVDVVDHREMPADAVFDREWAVAIIDRGLAVLERESDPKQFAALKPWISSSAAVASQLEVASKLGMSEGALKVAIYRLRRRFRELVRNDILQTLDDPSELDAEMQYLVQVLTNAGR